MLISPCKGFSVDTIILSQKTAEINNAYRENCYQFVLYKYSTARPKIRKICFAQCFSGKICYNIKNYRKSVIPTFFFPLFRVETSKMSERGGALEDNRIIELFFERSEAAISETEKKYGQYCRYIAYRILENEEDAKEIVNDTYLKMWSLIPPNRPDRLKPYIGMISRQLSLDRYEKNHAKKRGGEVALVLDELSECIPDNDSRADIGESVGLKDALNRFVRSLPDRTQNIFVRRYWYSSTVSEIAQEYGMKESSVTVLLHRTRKRMKKFLSKEGFDI